MSWFEKKSRKNIVMWYYVAGVVRHVSAYVKERSVKGVREEDWTTNLFANCIPASLLVVKKINIFFFCKERTSPGHPAKSKQQSCHRRLVLQKCLRSCL